MIEKKVLRCYKHFLYLSWDIFVSSPAESSDKSLAQKYRAAHCKMFPNPEDRTPECTYKITANYSPADMAKGTVRYEAFVRDVNTMLTALDDKLDEFRLKSRADSYYYSCKLDKILSTAGIVLGDRS